MWFMLSRLIEITALCSNLYEYFCSKCIWGCYCNDCQLYEYIKCLNQLILKSSLEVLSAKRPTGLAYNFAHLSSRMLMKGDQME